MTAPVPVDLNQIVRDIRPLIIGILGAGGVFIARLHLIKKSEQNEDYKVTQREKILDKKLSAAQQQLVEMYEEQIENLTKEKERYHTERDRYLSDCIKLQTALNVLRQHRDFWRNNYNNLVSKHSLPEPYPDSSNLPEHSLINVDKSL